MTVNDKKRILIAPLDWGLGHATRCIPIIRELIHEGHEVLIGTDGKAEILLRIEFPGLTFIPLHGYRIRYSWFFPMTISMLFQSPKILWRIFKEHLDLKKIIRQQSVDVIISDNRYGLWNSKIHSVFISHQLMVKCPPSWKFAEPLLHRFTLFFTNHYDECWIPDDGRKLAGDLAHLYPRPSNSKLIGVLSRWKEKGEDFSVKKKYDVIGLVSGPEPHRSHFEKLLITQLSRSFLHSLIVLGKPGEYYESTTGDHLRVISHLDEKKLLGAIASADIVICCAGYSSIMDLVAIRKNAILIPTPGQTEQEYLASYLKGRKIFFSVSRDAFQMDEAILESKNYSVKNYYEESDNKAMPGVAMKEVSVW